MVNGILRYLSKYMPLQTLDQMYNIFVRPHFDYCDVIYHIPQLLNPFDSTITLSSSMETIENQYQVALAITGGWQGSDRNELYDGLGCESLSDGRWSRRIIQLFKIRSNMTPAYRRDNLPRLRGLLLGGNYNHNK